MFSNRRYSCRLSARKRGKTQSRVCRRRGTCRAPPGPPAPVVPVARRRRHGNRDADATSANRRRRRGESRRPERNRPMNTLRGLWRRPRVERSRAATTRWDLRRPATVIDYWSLIIDYWLSIIDVTRMTICIFPFMKIHIFKGIVKWNSSMYKK